MSNSAVKPTIAVIGLGLLGGSICQSLYELNFDAHVIGISSQAATQEALELGIISEAFHYSDLPNLKSTVDLFIFCTPIKHIFSMVDSLAQSPLEWKHGAMVTDVGSTKVEICEHAWKNLGKDRFIGGHPMAGSEKSGLSARDVTLYESALWILTPDESQKTLISNSLLETVIQSLGARLQVLDPLTHDQWLAQVSHLPQLLSTSLSSSTLRHQAQALNVSGPGYRDMTRLALSSFPMWESIVQTNTSEILTSLDYLVQELQKVQHSIKLQDWTELAHLFEQAHESRQQVEIPNKGWSSNLIEVLVSVKDQKGMISKIVVPLTEASLDIRDIQLLKIREGSGGTLSLSFASMQIAEQAVQLLTDHGIIAQVRGKI